MEPLSAESRFALNRRTFLLATAAALACGPIRAIAQSTVESEKARRHRPVEDPKLPADLAGVASLSLVLGRVSDRSATLNLLSQVAAGVAVDWGTKPDRLDKQSKPIHLKASEPTEFEFDSLTPNSEYFYRVQPTGGRPAGEVHHFHTQRTPGSSFTFTIQGDSHPERPQMFDAALYARTLQAVAADRPDFHICMGDDFSVAKLAQPTEQSVASRYALQRPFLGLVGKSAPVYLLNGNHEQASLYNYDQKGLPHDVAVWAQQARNKFFSLPEPDDFFGGNAKPLEGIGLMRDYYNWTWGDALFVVLDNYWHSPACVDTKLNEDDQHKARGGKDRDWWGITLGDEQYQWFKKTLETSRAKYKFVFAHHVMGTGRGGIERAGLYEWGGLVQGGGNLFKNHRPTWELPIHKLMAKHGVSIFFQGHDHLYARQELDGVIYQTTPIPADAGYAIYNDDRYTSGVKFANSGYLRVNVSPSGVKVEYVRSYLPGDLTLNRKHLEITHSYTV